MNKLIFFLAGIIILQACNQSAEIQLVVPPTDSNINIIGRTIINNDENIEFEWPGVSIEVIFKGSSCTVLMDDSKKNYYNIFIDGELEKVVYVNSDTSLLLANGLSNEIHKLLITRRTEGNQGRSIFKGFILNPGASLLPATKPSGRRIEFIGNSITCGYGTEAELKEDPFLPEEENNYFSYAPITARAFGAEAHIIAHSGQGVVRNYGHDESVSEYTMPDRYMQVFDDQKEPLWDFTSWIPDMVVINLGTNDYSTQPQPSEKEFIGGYMKLIETVRSNYGSLPVFCVVGPMIGSPCYSYVENMVGALTNDGDQNIYFIGLAHELLAEEDWGAWHPKYSGQIKMAKVIVPYVSKVLDWDYEITD